MSTCRRCRARSIWRRAGRTSFPVDKALHARRLSRARLSPVRRARGARRYSGAARRSHPSRAGVARDFARRKPTGAFDGRGFVVTQAMTSLTGIRRRGFCLDPARARLSHGPAARRCRRSRRRSMSRLSPLRRRRSKRAATEATSPRRRARSAGRSRRRTCRWSGDPAPSAALLPDVTPVPSPAKSPRLWSRLRRTLRREPCRRKPRSRKRRSCRRCRSDRAPQRKLREAAPKLRREAPRSRSRQRKPHRPKPLPPKPTDTKAGYAGRACTGRSLAARRPFRGTPSASRSQPPAPSRPRPARRRSSRPPPAKAPTARRASSAIAAAAVTTNSAKPARAHRPMPRLRRRPLPRARRRAEARQDADRPPRERFEGKGRDNDNRRDKFDRNKGDRNKGGGRGEARARRPRFRRTRQGRPRQARQWPVAPSVGDQRRPARARSSGRSQFAVRKTGGAEGTARRPQGIAKAFSSEVGSGSRSRKRVKDSFERQLERQRLDKWLWHARVVKARTSRCRARRGRPRPHQRRAREGAGTCGEDSATSLTIALDRTVRMLKVTGFSERRGDATAARVLYEDLQNRQRVTICTEQAARR